MFKSVKEAAGVVATLGSSTASSVGHVVTGCIPKATSFKSQYGTFECKLERQGPVFGALFVAERQKLIFESKAADAISENDQAPNRGFNKP